MLDGLLLNKVTGAHNTNHDDDDNSDDTSNFEKPLNSSSTDPSRAQAVRPRKNTTTETPTGPAAKKMAGSNTYDRLEGGLSSPRVPAGRRNWKKYAIIAGLVLAVLWFAAPRSERYLWNKDKGATYPDYEHWSFLQTTF